MCLSSPPSPPFPPAIAGAPKCRSNWPCSAPPSSSAASPPMSSARAFWRVASGAVVLIGLGGVILLVRLRAFRPLRLQEAGPHEPHRLDRPAPRLGPGGPHPRRVLRPHGARRVARHLALRRRSARLGGPLLGILAIVSGAARAMVNTLPVTVLIGTIIGVLDLQARRELTVIKATGASIWRVMRAPVLAALLLGLFAAFVADSARHPGQPRRCRFQPPAPARPRCGSNSRASDGPYILYARRSRADGTVLDDVDVFFTDRRPARPHRGQAGHTRRRRLGADRTPCATGPIPRPRPLDQFHRRDPHHRRRHAGAADLGPRPDLCRADGRRLARTSPIPTCARRR